MIDIPKGRYWDLPWSLVSGCTPCSPGCDHCWALAMERRFCHPEEVGRIQIRPERLSIPLKRRKPTVYAVWNDFWHESVPDDFQYKAYDEMVERHTFLILTKRPHIAAAYYAEGKHEDLLPRDNIYHGLTVCNQQEANEKITVFLQVPGKKFLSLEPLLGPIDLRPEHLPSGVTDPYWLLKCIDAVILGGETGPGARPLHPDWVRSVRDQCAAAGVPFFLKSLGEWGFLPKFVSATPIPGKTPPWGKYEVHTWDDGWSVRVGKKNLKNGRLLDGRTHNDLPWVK